MPNPNLNQYLNDRQANHDFVVRDSVSKLEGGLAIDDPDFGSRAAIDRRQASSKEISNQVNLNKKAERAARIGYRHLIKNGRGAEAMELLDKVKTSGIQPFGIKREGASEGLAVSQIQGRRTELDRDRPNNSDMQDLKGFLGKAEQGIEGNREFNNRNENSQYGGPGDSPGWQGDMIDLAKAVDADKYDPNGKSFHATGGSSMNSWDLERNSGLALSNQYLEPGSRDLNPSGESGYSHYLDQIAAKMPESYGGKAGAMTGKLLHERMKQVANRHNILAQMNQRANPSFAPEMERGDLMRYAEEVQKNNPLATSARARKNLLRSVLGNSVVSRKR